MHARERGSGPCNREMDGLDGAGRAAKILQHLNVHSNIFRISRVYYFSRLPMNAPQIHWPATFLASRDGSRVDGAGWAAKILQHLNEWHVYWFFFITHHDRAHSNIFRILRIFVFFAGVLRIFVYQWMLRKYTGRQRFSCESWWLTCVCRGRAMCGRITLGGQTLL